MELLLKRIPSTGNYTEGKIPQGIKQQGFTEKAWLKKDLDAYLKNKNKL